MADFFDTEEVVKEYDSKLSKRILSYVKPYKGLLAITAITLILSTLGELLVPLLQQRVIDESIIVRFHTVNINKLEQEGRNDAIDLLLASKRSIEAGGRLFIPMERETRISSGAESELLESGILDSGDWYAFRYSQGDAAEQVVKSRANVFLLGDNAAAILKSDLNSLPLKEITAVRAGDISRIKSVAVWLFFVLSLVFLFTFMQTWGASLVSQRALKAIRLQLFNKTLYQSTAFLSRHPVGRIVTRLTGDVETIDEFFTTVVVSFLKDISVMIGVLVALFLLSPRLALAAIITMPPVLFVSAISRIKARDAFRKQRTASSRLNSYLSERLSGVQVVQLFLGEKKSKKEFSERNRELLRAKLGEMYVFAIFRPSIELFSTITTATIIVVGAAMVLNLSLSLGMLIAFIHLIGMMYHPLMDIAEKYTLLQSAMAGSERIFKLLDTNESIGDEGTKHIDSLFEDRKVNGRIKFRDVRFSYTGSDTEEVLKGLSFSVNPGEMTAIVGYTGAGKTTITNVLARLWDINGGEILLDGIPIQDIPLDELRRSCLPVLQDVFLFSGTVADNIRLGLPLSDEQVEYAARSVYAHEFISKLKDGYATILSEGATNISSGQRQLISFARVIAHNPGIVILDEATSSVDTETERLIQLGLQKVLAGRTSIVIAHRLSTIRNANRILVLSAGRVAEQGTHDELIAKNGLYAKLNRLQYTEI